MGPRREESGPEIRPKTILAGISTSLSGCKSNGPLFLFEAPSYEIPPPPSAAMVLSALSHFTSNQAVNCPRPKKGAHGVPIDSCTLGVSGAVGQCKACRQYSTSALMLARPSLQRSIRAFGSGLQKRFPPVPGKDCARAFYCNGVYKDTVPFPREPNTPF